MGILFSGLILLIALPQRGHSVELVLAPTLGPISVDISGAVVQPGLYVIPRGSRVADIIDAAKGMTNDADFNRVNLADKVRDGEKVLIPVIQPTLSALQSETNKVVAFSDQHPVNINIATLEQLDSLSGIGPTRAQDIINYRNQNGDFKSIQDLMNVSGIGQSIFDKIKTLISVE